AVKFYSNNAANIVSWSDTQITVAVPNTAVSGVVTVTSGGVSSNANISFTVPPPQITGISPTSGVVGTQLTINGSRFQSTKGSSSVLLMTPTFNFTLNTVSWSDTQLVA